MSTYLGNVRITINDTIKNWWKLGYFDRGQITRDNGEGDVDFYTYWYSIAYTLGMINVYRRIFRDVDSYETVLRKFFQSREIAIKNSDVLDTLEYVFDNHIEDLKRRGTVEINRFVGRTKEIGLSDYTNSGSIVVDISENVGVGVLSNTTDLVGLLSETINIGLYHSIEFDVLFSDVSGNSYVVGGEGVGALLVDSTANGILMSLTPGGIITSCDFTYLCGWFTYTFTVNVDVTVLNKVKFLRYESFVVFYLNDVYVGREAILLNDALAYDVYSFDRLFTASLPAIANIVVKKRDDDFEITNVYSWLCCEGSGCHLDSNQSPSYYATLDIVPSTLWSTVWRRSELFANTDYVGIDGESRRLVDYTYGEHLLELINVSEMGWAMDISSPISEEAGCVNLNKAYQKGVITDISKFPITFSNVTRPYVDNGYIRFELPPYNIDYYGINTDFLVGADWRILNNYKPLGQVPFIPINIATYDDDIDGYEISFVIKTTRNIRLKFGIATYDSSMNVLTGKTKRYDTDGVSDMFLESINFTLCEDQDIWIRGVYSMNKLTTVADLLNINFGRNLYNDSTDEVAFIVPIIGFTAVGSYDIDVYLKDIVVRPLTLNTEKGVVVNKNRVVGYMKNRSGKSDVVVQNFVKDKLIPYNCVTNIQFL